MDKIYEKVKSILDNEKIAYLATSNNNNVDNATIVYSSDDDLNIYFGSYSDTLKCRNISENTYVALCVSTLQIHGVARKILYNSEEYKCKIKKYNLKFPQYTDVFENENNELYEVKPLVVWNYNPSKGEMHRDKIVFDQTYYDSLKPYIPPAIFNKRKSQNSGITCPC